MEYPSVLLEIGGLLSFFINLPFFVHTFYHDAKSCVQFTMILRVLVNLLYATYAYTANLPMLFFAASLNACCEGIFVTKSYFDLLDDD